MIGHLFEKLLKKNRAPEWFCADIKKRVPEAEIKDKIREAIKLEVVERGYSLEAWDEDFTNRMTNLYYKFFDQLYMDA